MVTTQSLLALFLVLKFCQHLIERGLSALNRRHYLNPDHQAEAVKYLGISQEDLQKTLNYSKDKYWFGKVTDWVQIIVLIIFIGMGGLGWIEKLAIQLSLDLPIKPLSIGLVFFGIISFISFLFSLPFDYYFNFVIEEKHGFNRQKPKEFFKDKLKGLLIGMILGGILLILLLYIMQNMGKNWWVYGWITFSAFSVFTMLIYPSLIAPLFNKFNPLPEGELKEKILDLSKRVNFRTNGLFVMDASKRSSHGNAYFTGIFGKKRIVLFDTLVNMLNTNQVVAVLAHELGHFKLHHIRWGMIREILFSGLLFYILSLCLPLEIFYKAFSFEGVSNYAALVVFGLWFGPIELFLKPIRSSISRKNEFSADRFATNQVGNWKDLGEGLLKLREKSRSMPISHPLFSLFYHSHPPILERLKVLSHAG